jgi:heptosyltransferase-3
VAVRLATSSSRCPRSGCCAKPSRAATSKSSAIPPSPNSPARRTRRFRAQSRTPHDGAAVRQNAPIDEALAEHLRSFNLVVSFLYDPDGLFRASMERVGVKTLIECSPRVQNEGEHASKQLAKGLEKLAMFLEDDHLHRAHFERRLDDQRTHRHPRRQRFGEEKLAAGALAAAGRCVFRSRGHFHHRRGRTGAWREDRFNITNWHSLPLCRTLRPSQHLSAFLGHDSGISHLAAACGVPSLLLFGPTDPAVWAPPQPWVRILREEGMIWPRCPLSA